MASMFWPFADNDRVTEAAERLSSSDGQQVQSLRADLASYDGVETLCRKIQEIGRPIDAIAINAGVGLTGPFAESDLTAQMNLLQLNVVGPVHLTPDRQWHDCAPCRPDPIHVLNRRHHAGPV